MKKKRSLKRVLLTSAVVTSSCILGACGNSRQVVFGQEQNEQEEVEENTMEQFSEQTNQEGQAVGVTIDYNIESYDSVWNFGHGLFAQSIHDRNPVLSPVSAYLALTMAGCGADGTTKDEFYRVLGNDMLPLSDDMMNTFPADGSFLQLSIANSAWMDDELTVDDTWLGTVSSLLDAETFQTELASVEAVNEINNWIADKTNGLIDKMLTEPLDEQTRLALFNTVYFKGKWEMPFEFQNTHKEDFYLHRGQEETEQVDMMNLYMTELEYLSCDFAEGVILPYQMNVDENLAFVALKPTGEGDVREVFEGLTREVVADILVNRQTEPVNLKLPKFEITFDKILNESLSNMGLRECFDAEKANFDRIGKTQSGDNLYIGLARQKAKIIVDEEGTEAAAVTELLMRCAGIIEPQEPRELYFNEPFLYMIMDMDSGIPLFIGILDQPGV